MNRSILPGLAALAVLGLAACEEDVPTSVDPDLFPVTPRTVELVLPWSSFGADLDVIGGFGTPTELFIGVLANDFEGVLDARTLARYNAPPDTLFVQDAQGTTVRSKLSYKGGSIFLRFDTLSARVDGPVTVVAGATQAEWHPPTATWTIAVDTINHREPWPVPGGGPVSSIASAVWDPAEGDTLLIPVDSATIAAWSDTTDSSRGLRLEAIESGVRLQIRSIFLRLDAVPEAKPDTVLHPTVAPQALTFIYDPVPEPPPNGIRIGGVPAWRTIIEMDIPDTLTGPPEVCERVGCPFVLEPGRINAASLVLESRATEPAFQPSDTVLLDVRPVLAPERLPKSPLGESFVGIPGRPVPPEAFGEEAGQQVAIPITGFVRALLRGEDAAGNEPPNTLALLSFFEPLSISFATFEGPGAEGEPFLRLLVTLTDTVQVR